MHASQRDVEILRLLQSQGFVSFRQLCAGLDASSATIRRGTSERSVRGEHDAREFFESVGIREYNIRLLLDRPVQAAGVPPLRAGRATHQADTARQSLHPSDVSTGKNGGRPECQRSGRSRCHQPGLGSGHGGNPQRGGRLQLFERNRLRRGCDEGFEDVAEWLETLARAEKSHAGRFAQGLESIS